MKYFTKQAVTKKLIGKAYASSIKSLPKERQMRAAKEWVDIVEKEVKSVLRGKINLPRLLGLLSGRREALPIIEGAILKTKKRKQARKLLLDLKWKAAVEKAFKSLEKT